MADHQDHFRRIQWCNELLQAPGHVAFTPACRLKKDADGNCESKDQLFSVSLHNEGAVPHITGFYESNPPGDGNDKTSLLIGAATLLFDLRAGVNGFNNVTHGGVVAALIDETMGNFVWVNKNVQEEWIAEGRSIPDHILPLTKVVLWTTGMNVKLQKAIPPPKIVIVRTELVEISGRKVFLKTTIKDETGVQYAQCDGLWVSVPKTKL